MADTQIISFTGIDHPDVVYFLGKLLSVNSTVLVIDNSERHNLYRDIHAGRGDDIIITGKTAYMFDTALSDAFSEFDYVIIYHGMKPDADLWKASSKRILMVDSDANNLSDIKTGLQKVSVKDMMDVMFCDLMYSKVTEENIVHILNIGGRTTDNVYNLPFDPDNIEILQMLEYNGKHAVKDITAGMSELLKDLYGTLTGTELKPRDFRKLIKAAG